MGIGANEVDSSLVNNVADLLYSQLGLTTLGQL